MGAFWSTYVRRVGSYKEGQGEQTLRFGENLVGSGEANYFGRKGSKLLREDSSEQLFLLLAILEGGQNYLG